MGCKLIGLIRVSTDKQGESGLGLEGQQAAIEAYRAATDCHVIKVYTEVESGTHDDMDARPELKKAVAHAKRSNAKLIIAKMDRLVRSIPVLSYLKTNGVPFIACDNPNANELMVDILVSVAANEARMISQRTKDGLKAYRDGRHVSKRLKTMYPGGVPQEIADATAGKLGAELPQCRNLTDAARTKGTEKSAKVRAKASVDAYADLVLWLKEMRDQGSTLQKIADRLNAEGHTTRTRKPWNAVQVMRVLDRANA